MNQLKDNLKGGIQLSLYERLSDEERVCNFQRKIYQKAKQETSFKFYRLYDEKVKECVSVTAITCTNI